MWESIPDWEKILKACAIGLEWGFAAIVGWYLMRLRTSSNIKHLREQLRIKNGM